MPVLKGKSILIGVTGGIAAYKVAFLVRLLRKNGAIVKIVMTTDATNFVTPLTLATLSGQEVVTDFIKKQPNTTEWNNHIQLAIWADYLLIAPLTANTLSKIASGQSDNLLTAIYLSTRCPIVLAPPMDIDMWQHPATTENIQKLVDRGNLILYPEKGELASGLYGQGRMSEPENIVSYLKEHLYAVMPLRHKTILITAGPTHEKIDAVRFIGNKSSGRMGFEITKKALSMGAKVILVAGPTEITPPKDEQCQYHRVSSAQEMFEQTMQYAKESDIIIMAAAVADYTPLECYDQKIKKAETSMHILLKPTKDILFHLGKHKFPKQFLMGFALESDSEIQHSIKKLESKNLDAIVLNSLRDKGAGFETKTNKITIIDREKNLYPYELKSKSEVATDILNFICEKIGISIS